MGILEGRVAIITGASSGIGWGAALKFAEEGASVVVCARRKERLDDLVKQITEKGGKAIAVKCDVSKEEDIDNVVNTCIREFKKVDILYNNAQGGMTNQQHLEDVSIEDAMSLYSMGPVQSMLFMQKCLPYMKEAHYGRIINTASLSCLTGAEGVAAYAMAKGGTMALTRLAAKDWAKYGIVTNTVMPLIKSEAFDFPDEMIPTGHFGTPYEDCAPMTAFLASEGAGYINGQVISIDGGFWFIA